MAENERPEGQEPDVSQSGEAQEPEEADAVGRGPAAADEPAADQPAADEEPAAEEEPAVEEEQPAAEEEQPAADEEQRAAEEVPAASADEQAPTDEEAPADEQAPAEEGAAEPEPAGDAPRPEQPKPKRRRRKDAQPAADEVIPGADLEPDLVLEEEAREGGEFGEYAEPQPAEADEAPADEPAEAIEEGEDEAAPVAREPLDLAADARYAATGKRKSSVARVTLSPGDGTYRINGRHLDEYFPRIKLQRMARQPLEVAGYGARLDVVARLHGGGVSAQATALRHGIARALVEADPSLRVELKRRGYLTRDPRVKERKKAGLKKARKRPQFSKR
jgi:small subunit ribosomal protein S9